MIRIRRVPQLGPSRESVWAEFARENGGTFFVGDEGRSLKEWIDPACRIVLKREAFNVQIASLVSAHTGSRNTYVRFSFDFSTSKGEFLVASPRTIWDMLPLPFRKIVPAGNRKLDRAFSFGSSDPRKVELLFSDEKLASFMLADPSMILNIGKIRRTHAPPKPKGSLFLLDRIGDIRKKEKLSRYLDFCLRCAARYREVE